MKRSCRCCGECCTYIGIGIDTPIDIDDYNFIFWYLLHENVRVYVTEEGWFVEIKTRCKVQSPQNLCSLHAAGKKPKICRDYDSDSCTGSGNDIEELFSFGSAEDFMKYLAERDISLQP